LRREGDRAIFLGFTITGRLKRRCTVKRKVPGKVIELGSQPNPRNREAVEKKSQKKEGVAKCPRKP